MTTIRWKKVLTIPLIFVIIVPVVFAIDAWLRYEDNGLTQARREHKFGKSTQYIIVKTEGSGATIETNPPYIYAIHKPNEPTSSASLSWRRIGQSKVDLEKFVNKRVYIEGEFYEGTPLLINTPKKNRYGILDTQPVIRIDNLILAE